MSTKTNIEKKSAERYKADFEISWQRYEELGRFINDRARIIGRKRTTLTAKKQRRIARAIKQARFLGLLPYKPSI